MEPCALDRLSELRIDVDGLTLRVIPVDDLVHAGTRIASRGVSDEAEPFMPEWYQDNDLAGSGRRFVATTLLALDSLQSRGWELPLGIYEAVTLLGVQGLRSRGFYYNGDVSTWSWLFSEHRGRGVGTAARWAALHLAFVELGARRTESMFAVNNEASRRVCEKLGYTMPGGMRGSSVRVGCGHLKVENFAAGGGPVVHCQGVDGLVRLVRRGRPSWALPLAEESVASA